MAKRKPKRQDFNVVIIGQNGRLQYEAALFAASLRHSDPDFKGRLLVMEPQPGGAWPEDPRMQDEAVRDLLGTLEAEILPFDAGHFGKGYPPGNKIEALGAVPEDAPFVFFDTDTLVTGKLSEVPFDFARPSASMRREGTWPEIQLYGPSYHDLWKSLYDRFGLEFESTIDTAQPEEYWERYLYFNAGWFFHENAREFGQRFLDYALSIRDDTPDTLAAQALYPWLDQIVLPLVIHSFGGGRQTIPEGLLDGSVTCHYRLFPLLYAREDDRVIAALDEIAAPNKIKKVLKAYEPIKRMVYQNRGAKVRALFDRDHLPSREQVIRNRIKKEKLWMR